MTDIYEPKVGDVVDIRATIIYCDDKWTNITVNGILFGMNNHELAAFKLVERPVETPKVGEIWETRFNSWSLQYEIIAVSDTQLVVKYIKDGTYIVWSHGHYTASVNFFKVS